MNATHLSQAICFLNDSMNAAHLSPEWSGQVDTKKVTKESSRANACLPVGRISNNYLVHNLFLFASMNASHFAHSR
jgi:hypothetical protein